MNILCGKYLRLNMTKNKRKVPNKETARRRLQSGRDLGVTRRGNAVFTPIKGTNVVLVEDVEGGETSIKWED